MDLSKALDMVSWDKLFPELLKRKISPLILRGLNQICNMRWGNIISQPLNGKMVYAMGCSILAYIVLCLYK